MPHEKYVEAQAWAGDAPPWAPRAIGVLEVLGAVGLVLPAAAGVAPILVPFAATGLALVMAGAVVLHLRRAEFPALVPSGVLLVLAAVAALVEREQGQLDVLVDNAAVRPERKPVAEVTAADARKVFDTGTTGVIRGTCTPCLPLLEQAGHGVVVDVGSGTGSFGRVHDPDRLESRLVEIPYTASKAALSMLTVQYAKAYPGLRIDVVDPGPTATGMNSLPGVQPVEVGAAPIVRAARSGPADPTGRFLDAAGGSPW